MQVDKLWKLTIEELQLSTSEAGFNSWLKPLTATTRETREDEYKVTILCPTPFHQTIVKQKFGEEILQTLRRVSGGEVEVDYSLNLNTTAQSKKPIGPLFAQQEQQQSAFEIAMSRVGLREDFSFDNFAVSSSNEMAYAAAMAVADNFATAYNPLFLYGGVGVGKTHLMQAIGIQKLHQHPDTSMIYCMSEEFTNDIIEAIQQKKTAAFRTHYRKVKALLIDDIQFIAGKTTVQEEFFHTFNAVMKAGGQIIMTSDRSPAEIKDLEARLRSRFEAGLLVDIGKPDFELRTAITLIKSKHRGLQMNMAEAQMIAANIESARAIEGFLTKLTTEVQLKQRSIDLTLIEALLGKTSLNKDEAPPPLRPLEIIRGVAKYYQISTKELQGKIRRKGLVLPRHVAMYLLRVDYQLPLMEVAHLFSGRDHTTVMHAVDKITRKLTEEENLRMDVAEVRKMLYT